MSKISIELPGFEEMTTGEVQDFVLDTIKKERDQIPNDFICRKKDICDAILKTTKNGSRDRLHQEISDKIRTTPACKLTGLEKFGFQLERNKHFKLSWNGKPYKLVIPMSPSDHRYLKNLLADLDHKFF